MKFLVDANVLSEPTKPAPDSKVVDWLRRHEREIAVDPIVLAELEFGILLLPVGKRRRHLKDWFDRVVRRLPVLDFDARSATEWASLLARLLKRRGLAMSVKDSLIAATALVHGLTLVTRNTSDFKHAGLKLLNPFTP
ncbi:MAG: type II toxin-antitoxin system VapC family toxin [Planctomycetes bacterium]|nr:type II toxin-antitoxin system VapC family toxin [Planctomycetota bacterium]